VRQPACDLLASAPVITAAVQGRCMMTIQTRELPSVHPSAPSPGLHAIAATTDPVQPAVGDARRTAHQERRGPAGTAVGCWSLRWHRDQAGQWVLCQCLPLALRCIGYPVETSEGVPIGVVRAVSGPYLAVAAHSGGELHLEVSAIRSTTGGRIRLHRDAAALRCGTAPRSPQ
jgi:hypothetical protein